MTTKTKRVLQTSHTHTHTQLMVATFYHAVTVMNFFGLQRHPKPSLTFPENEEMQKRCHACVHNLACSHLFKHAASAMFSLTVAQMLILIIDFCTNDDFDLAWHKFPLHLLLVRTHYLFPLCKIS